MHAKSQELIALLVPEVRLKALETFRLCETAGVPLRFYYTLRTAEMQAKLWRQGRPAVEINAAIKRLRDQGKNELAELLKRPGPQTGPKVTNALPGESYHQIGRAWDAGPYDATIPDFLWDVKTHHEKWDVYREAVEMSGMTSGASWNDWPHAEWRIAGASNPTTALGFAAVWDLMKNMGTLETLV